MGWESGHYAWTKNNLSSKYMVLFLTKRKVSECALWEFCTERAWLSQWSNTERAAKKVSFSNPYSSCLSWGTATLAGTEQRWWRCGVTQSESFPGSGSEDSYKLYAVICWFKINPGCVCKVTGRCWKANANICALKKVSLVGRDLANYRLVCSRWAGIWSQRKMIYVCIIKEVTSQCLGDPRAPAVLPGGRLKAAQGCAEQDCTSHFEKRCFACAPPKYAAFCREASGILAAGPCCCKPCLWAPCMMLSFPKPCACGLHRVSTWNLRAKAARVRAAWRLTVGSIVAPSVTHLAPSFCPPCLESFSSRFCSFSMFIFLWCLPVTHN